MSQDVNNVTLIGRLTRDCELRYTDGGMGICAFALAVGYRRKRGEEWTDEVNYFDLVLFGKRGEALSRYLTKGKQVGIEGELRQDRWEQDGQKRSKVQIIVRNIQLVGGSGSSAGRPYDSPADSPPPATQNPGAPASDAAPTPPSPSSAVDSFDDDIPF